MTMKDRLENLLSGSWRQGHAEGDVLTLDADLLPDWQTPASPGGSIAVVRQTVHYSDFAAPVDDNSFVAVHTFSVGDVLLRLGVVCTQTFNDSGHGSLAFQFTDPDNGTAFSTLTSGGDANPGAVNGLQPMEYLPLAGDDTEQWDNAGRDTTMMAQVSVPLTVGISDNGRLNRDGSTGAFEVVLVYIPAT